MTRAGLAVGGAAGAVAVGVIVGVLAPPPEGAPPPPPPSTAAATPSPASTRTTRPATPTRKSTAAPARTATPTQAVVSPIWLAGAAAKLDKLPVKGRAPSTGYTRDAFPHWADTDSDGCDADDQAIHSRGNLEMRDSCREVAGVMVDPYTGRELRWGAKRSGVIDVDHVVPLGNAWATGAQSWGVAKRRAFANDQDNLVPTAADVNRVKGDRDAASWLPPLKTGRCEYVGRQVVVKDRFGLWVTGAEKSAMRRVLTSCGAASPSRTATSKAPSVVPRVAAPTRKPTPERAATSRPTRKPAPKWTATPKATRDAALSLRTCEDVKSAGLGPYVRGVDPEYGSYRDADGDGVVCE